MTLARASDLRVQNQSHPRVSMAQVATVGAVCSLREVPCTPQGAKSRPNTLRSCGGTTAAQRSTMGTAKGNVLDQYRCMELYNAIDSRNYSLAVKRADALLQAGPFPLASALKTVALFRLGQTEEAAQEAERVLSQKVDLNVIMPLEMVLPRLGRVQQLADLYLAASQAHPDDEELAEGALLCLVKNCMYQRALQLILKRFRISKERKDFWRYIQVSILHSQRLQPPGSKLALEVAHRLLQEQVLEDTSFSEETLSLYLLFFLLQGKDRLQGALQMLEKPHCQTLASNSLTIQFQLRECWRLLGDNESLLRDCRSRVAQGDRNWAVLSEWIHTMGQVASGSMNCDDVDLVVKAAEQDKWKDRGSFLGVLELFRVSQECGLEKPCDLIYADLVRRYLETFITKPSCFDDIRPYLAHIPEADRGSLVTWAHDIPDLSTESDIIRKVNASKLARYFQTDSGHKKATFVSLLQDHSRTLKHVHVPDTEMHPGDELVLLAAMEVLATGPEGLSTAAMIAFHGCQESKRAYRLRLLLIRLLLRLGCFKLAIQHFEALGLKAVQFDTVSHYMMDRNSSFGGSHAVDIANIWDSHVQEFYMHSAYEVPEALSRAFSNGKFSQVSDLCEFNDCLEHSCAKIILQLDMVRSKFVNQDLVGSDYILAQQTVQKIIEFVNGMLTLITTADRISDQRDQRLISFVCQNQQEVVEHVTSCGPLRGVCILFLPSRTIGSKPCLR